MPSPEVAFAWGSQSTSNTFSPSIARQADRLIAVVVLPTPPFWFTIPTIFPMGFKGNGPQSLWDSKASVENRYNLWKADFWGGEGLLQLTGATLFAITLVRLNVCSHQIT